VTATRHATIPFLVALVVLLFGGACRSTHLGGDTGLAYREAIAQQRESQAPVDPIDAADAKAVLQVHHGGGAEADSPAGGAATTSTSSSSSSGSSGMWQGAEGDIVLKAK
jgi:hypothetical protein